MNNRPRFNPWLHEYYARFGSGPAPEGLPSLAFVIGSADISGGTGVIFQHAQFAAQVGAEVTIIPMLSTPDDARGWHPALAGLNFASFEEVADRKFDLAIATWWPTVMELPRLRFRHAAYLVQSIESRFYSVGEGNQFAALAELTYQLRLPVITIALWMQTFLAFEHQTPSFLVRNGIDKSIHRLDGPALAPREPGRQRVLIEGPVEAPMKGVDRAISVARAADASEVWLLTSSDVDSHDGCDRVISRIPAVDTPAVYRSCDVLLKLSNVEGMYGPPLEMFHAGGTVVTNDVTGSDEYLNSGVNGIVVPTDDDRATVEAIVSLRDPHLLARLQRGARDTAAGWPDWSHSSGEFLRVVNSIVRQDPPANLVQMMLMASGARALHETVTGL